MKLLTKIFGASAAITTASIPMALSSCSKGATWTQFVDADNFQEEAARPWMISKNTVNFVRGKTFTAKFDFKNYPGFISWLEGEKLGFVMYILDSNTPAEDTNIYSVSDKDNINITIDGKKIDYEIKQVEGKMSIVIEEWDSSYDDKSFSFSITPTGENIDNAYLMLYASN